MQETLIRLARHIDEKRYGKYRGIVTDNKDPQKRGRLRVRIPSVLADQDTDWALPCLPYGGASQQGMFMVPDVDAQVWVEFEEGDLHRPIWVGTFWQQAGDPPKDAAKKEPTTRLFQTKSGHILQFDDADGEEQFRLHHPTKAEMVIDPNGTISLTDAQGAIVTLDADTGKILMKDANGNKIEMAPSGITVKGQNIFVEGSQVFLGGKGGEPVIKGKSFLNLFDIHTHSSAMGKTGPPDPLSDKSSLSSTVKSK